MAKLSLILRVSYYSKMYRHLKIAVPKTDVSLWRINNVYIVVGRSSTRTIMYGENTPSLPHTNFVRKPKFRYLYLAVVITCTIFSEGRRDISFIIARGVVRPRLAGVCPLIDSLREIGLWPGRILFRTSSNRFRSRVPPPSAADKTRRY